MTLHCRCRRFRSGRLAALAVALVLIVTANTSAQPAPAVTPTAADAPPVQVRTVMNPPAMWLADHVTYSIELTCRRGIDILPDDLAPTKLKLTGLELLGSSTVRDTAANDSTRYRFDYVLTTWRVDAPSLEVAAPSVRYYVKRAGQRLQDTPAAGTIDIPSATVVLRSMLPNDASTAVARDNRVVPARASLYRAFMPLGLALVLVSLTPLVLLVVPLLRRQAARVKAGVRQTARQARQAARDAFATVREIEPATPDAQREAYTQLDTIVRAHLRDVWGVPAESLTPPEIAAALASRRGADEIDPAVAVLTACELGRYAPAAAPQPAQWREALANAELVLARGR